MSEAEFRALRARAHAFAANPYDIDIPEGRNSDGELRQALRDRIRLYAVLDEQLRDVALHNPQMAVDAWTDVADMRLALGEDFLSAPVDAGADGVTSEQDDRAARMRREAGDAVVAARRAGATPAQEEALTAVIARYKALSTD